MPLVAGTILTDARTGLLNDPNGAIYPDTPMYAVINKAYSELQTKMVALGLPADREISTPITVPTGTVSLGEGALLPADMLQPYWIGEKTVGSSLKYEDMTELDWEPDIIQQTTLRYWAWREEQIKFPGATLDRQIIIKYFKSLGTVTGVNSPIAVLNSQAWLSQRSAAIAALTIGGNPSRALALNADLVAIWDDLRSALVKKMQTLPVRRKRTRYRVP
jgi:hypothetical protein